MKVNSFQKPMFWQIVTVQEKKFKVYPPKQITQKWLKCTTTKWEDDPWIYDAV